MKFRIRRRNNTRNPVGLSRDAGGNCSTVARTGFALVGMLFMAGSLYIPDAVAQSNQDDFDVTVEPSPSQQEAVAQGLAGLNASTLQLRSLEQITDSFRDEHRYNRHHATSSSPQAYAALASLVTLIAPAKNSGNDPEVGSAFSRVNTFANLNYAFGNHDRTANSPKYDIDTFGVTAGADYRVNPDLVVGGAVGYVHNKSDFASGLGRLQLQGISGSVLASWYATRAWYFDGIAHYGANDYDSVRPLAGGGNARGKPDGHEYALSAGTGYEFNYRALTLIPTGRLNYTDIRIDGYRERDTVAGLTFKGQDIKSLNTNVGGEATYAINTSFGVLVPQADFEWVHEFKDSPRTIIAQSSGGGTPFGVRADPLDSNFFRLGLNGTAILPHGIIAFLRYEIELGRNNIHTQILTLGGRVELNGI